MSDGEGIVPEGFDLHKARYSTSSTPSQDRKRCPECKHADIHRKCDKPTGNRDHDTKYYCPHCTHHFDEPVYLTEEEVEEFQGIRV